VAVPWPESELASNLADLLFVIIFIVRRSDLIICKALRGKYCCFRFAAVAPSKIKLEIRSPLRGLKSVALLSQGCAALTLGYSRWLPPGASWCGERKATAILRLAEAGLARVVWALRCLGVAMSALTAEGAGRD
jgi:hypothetical protein